VLYINSAVHCAAARGHLDCVKALHEDAADMWVASDKGECPVHEAAMAKHNGKLIFYIVSAFAVIAISLQSCSTLATRIGLRKKYDMQRYGDMDQLP